MVGEKFSRLLETLGISKVLAAKELGVTKTAISDITNGRVKNLSGTMIELLKVKYNVNAGYWESEGEAMFLPQKLSQTSSIADPLDRLTGEERQVIERLINLLGEKNVLRIHKSEEPTEDFRKIPVVARIAAGNPMESIEHADGSLFVHKKSLPKNGTVFALRVRGDSMIGAGIMDGDLAIMSLVEDPSAVMSGEIVAISLDGASTLKRFLRDNGRFTLRAENPNYADRDITGNDFPKIVGRYLGIIRLPNR